MTVPTDLDRIEAVLEDAKRVAAMMCNGGLRELWYDLGFALDAVERVRTTQPPLFVPQRRQAVMGL